MEAVEEILILILMMRLMKMESTVVAVVGDLCTGRGRCTTYRMVRCQRIGSRVHHAPVGLTTLTTVTELMPLLILILAVALASLVAAVSKIF